ncbi:hypothetical protein [Ruegeria lacuscaerulensis]|uniref:hypothetical protein n=1 Tax=Ruegeria lacuscaerulensis TaxID=55218 RepID=UPI001480B7E3|nr:hypothetical protein [Ruegeria lacuscaerulensis]
MTARIQKILTAAGLAVLLVGCSDATRPLTSSGLRSEDPLLTGILQSFQHGCIETAPTFEESRVRAGFNANEPKLERGMEFLGGSTRDRSCEVIVRGYGTTRPVPTVGDINRLARAFASNTRLAYTPAIPGESTRAWVSSGNRNFFVTGFVTGDGDLQLIVGE